MKRRLLSAFLAVMMVLTMAPVAFAADGTNTSVDSYEKLVQAVANASDGDTITISGEIAIDAPLNITKSVTLTGGSIVADDTFSVNSKKLEDVNLINVKSADVELTLDNITLDAKQKCLVLFANAGTVCLNNATITGGKTGSCVAGVYMTSSAALQMTSGSITGNQAGDESYMHYASDLWIGANAYGYVVDGTIGNVFVNANRYSANDPGMFSMMGGNVTNLYAEYDSPSRYGARVIYNGGTIENLYISTTTGNGDCKKVTPVVGMEYNGGVTDDEAVAPVAQVGDTGYATLEEAFKNAVDGNIVKLLKNTTTTQLITVADGKHLTLDLNGNTVSSDLSTTIKVSNGYLTVKNGKVVANGEAFRLVGNNKPATWETKSTPAELTIASDVEVESATDCSIYIYGKGAKADIAGQLTSKGSYATIQGQGTINDQQNNSGTEIIIREGAKVISEKANAIYHPEVGSVTVEQGSYIEGVSSAIEMRRGTLTINGGVLRATSDEFSCMTNTMPTSGSTTEGVAVAIAPHGAVGEIGKELKVNITGGTFEGIYGLYQEDPDNRTKQGVSIDMSVTGGNFASVKKYQKDSVTYGSAVYSGECESFISGGYFTDDPSAYCVTGKTGVPSGNTTYPWTVGTVEVKDENEIKTDTQEGATQATLSSEIAKTDETAATAVGASVTPTKLTDTTPITADDKAQALTELVKNKKVTLNQDGTIPQDTTVTVVKKTYLDVTVTAYDTTSDTVSMDIVPKYDLIAVAKNGNSAAEQIVLKSAQDAKVGSTEVEVTLPNKFKGRKVYINHNNGANLYVATANKTTGKVKFTTNGFSPFTFALSNPNVVAEVNGNAYTSFKDAVNAVENNGTIEIVGGNKDYTATISGSSKTIKVKNSLTNGNIKVTVNGESKTIKPSEDATFTYTKPSSGGSSGGSSSGKTTYKVTTSAVNNGGVNASPSSAEKGATITITLSPDKGYKLDKLTVTDGSGKTVSTVKKSDTVYTFTMPASAVNVGVSYVKATETPSKTKFNDVSANDWFASAVDYVTGKGMMNGTADNTFSPKANTTRGMVVTVLYRLENQPSTSAASFTDVASGAYYANAVAWANANGIVSGYGSGKFGPNDKVTREQLAAILYRYAQYKKYDVSVGEDTNILSYNDAQSISSYAIPAIQWACGAGVVTGKSGSKLDPKGNATRAEVAAMLMRFCENVK